MLLGWADDRMSSRFAARSAPLLAELNIGSILSVTQVQDMPSFASGCGACGVGDGHGDGDADAMVRAFRERVVMKHIPIDDSPIEDLLSVLGDVCDWIDGALGRRVGVARGKGGGEGMGVLVHCTQGISRSGAVVVAYRTSPSPPLRPFPANSPGPLSIYLLYSDAEAFATLLLGSRFSTRISISHLAEPGVRVSIKSVAVLPV